MFDRSQSDNLLATGMIRQYALTLSLILFVNALSRPAFKKVTHNTDPRARCLDGSLPAMLIQEGDPNLIQVHFMQGGNCKGNTEEQFLEDCYKRSKTELGSTKDWEEKSDGDDVPFEGMLSPNPMLNFMANWTKAALIYCDGSMHQGYSKDPVKYKDTNLYFTGALNTWSHLKYLHQHFGLYQAKRVVLSGSSVGGLTMTLWGDKIAALFGPETDFTIIAESAIYELDYTAKKKADSLEKHKMLYRVANKDMDPPATECLSHFQQEPWACFSIENSFPFLRTKTLFLQSSYDASAITYFLGIGCLSSGSSGYTLTECNSRQMQTINEYHQYYMKYIRKQVVPSQHSIWSIACASHCSAYFQQFSSDLQRVPMYTGKTMNDVSQEFVMEKKTIKIVDEVEWPDNVPCAK